MQMRADFLAVGDMVRLPIFANGPTEAVVDYTSGVDPINVAFVGPLVPLFKFAKLSADANVAVIGHACSYADCPRSDWQYRTCYMSAVRAVRDGKTVWVTYGFAEMRRLFAVLDEAGLDWVTGDITTKRGSSVNRTESRAILDRLSKHGQTYTTLHVLLRRPPSAEVL